MPPPPFSSPRDPPPPSPLVGSRPLSPDDSPPAPQADDHVGPAEVSEPVEVLVEVTDTVSLPYTTGIQRVTRELLARLPRQGSPAFRPVRWTSACDGYRDLTGEEARVLADPPERLPRTTRLAARLPDPVAVFARRALASTIARRARNAIRNARDQRIERDRRHLCLASSRPEHSTVLLDLEAAWNDPVPRTELLPREHARGVRSAALIADVLPVLHPEWFDPQLITDFNAFLDGHLRYSELFLCISERTESDLIAVAAARGVNNLHTCVIPLGADLAPGQFATDDRNGVRTDARPERFDPLPERFLLLVGTLEPRKNQTLALDLLDATAASHPDVALVLVGKRGWHVEDLIRRIERHPALGRRLFWFEEVDDAALWWLYRQATICLTPAIYEGLGVCVMEALHAGTPVVCSTGGALPEAGGAAAEYIDPHDTDAWVHLVRSWLDDPVQLEQARRRAVAWQAPSWDDAAAAVRTAIAEVFGR